MQVQEEVSYEYYVVGGGLTDYPRGERHHPIRRSIYSDDELKEMAMTGKMKTLNLGRWHGTFASEWPDGFAIYENLYGAAQQAANNNHTAGDVWPVCCYYCPILKIKTPEQLTLNPDKKNKNNSEYTPKTLRLDKFPSSFCIEKIYLEGYYHLGNTKYHKETLDKIAKQPAFTTAMWVGVFTILFTIPVLVYAGYRKYEAYKATKLLSQTEWSFEKTAPYKWQIKPTNPGDELPVAIERVNGAGKEEGRKQDKADQTSMQLNVTSPPTTSSAAYNGQPKV